MLSQHRVWSQVCTCITLVHGSANHLFELLHKVRWAMYPERSTVEHGGVDHCGAHVLWPRSSWMVRMSCPRSRRCVAKEWRKVWQLAALLTLASAMARCTAFCTTIGSRWWRPWAPDSLSHQRFCWRNTHCQPHSRLAVGYFLASA